MVDVVISDVLALGFALLLLFGAWHKLSNTRGFRELLADYDILPRSLVTAVALLLPAVEIVLGLLWLGSGTRQVAAGCTIGLMLLYTVSIVLNLLRGRNGIACGCGFGGQWQGSHGLSAAHVWRNIALLSAAAVGTLPVQHRETAAVDYVTEFFALAALVLLYATTEQLIRNTSALRSLHRPAESER